MMAVSFKVWIGLGVAMLGLSGLVYSMQTFSNAVASHGPVFSEADVPPIPENMMAYVVLELVSAAIMTGGIAIMALGHYDTFNKQADISPPKGSKPIKDSKSKVAGAA